MTVKLGNIDLDDDLMLYGLEESEDILIAEMTSFDGTSDFMTMPAAGSRPLSLVASREGEALLGHFTISQIKAIKSIIAAGMPTTLIHHRGTFTVLPRSVTDFAQGFEHTDPADEDWCTATINMTEI